MKTTINEKQEKPFPKLMELNYTMEVSFKAPKTYSAYDAESDLISLLGNFQKDIKVTTKSVVVEKTSTAQ